MERVERAPDAPFHSIVNADNYHALQLLLYGYQRAFDVIYIDPPYNTGARDWKYNNDYIDKNDRFRHSKWLSMMKKRLVLAKQLLKPEGVLVVAIDDNEVHHLICLLNDIFGVESSLGVVAIRSKPSGSASQNGFASMHEYAVFYGGSRQTKIQLQERSTEQLARFNEEDEDGPFWWENFRKAGAASHRNERPGQYFPIWVTHDGKIEVPKGIWNKAEKNWEVPSPPKSKTAVYPRKDGKDRVWLWSPDRVRSDLKDLKVDFSNPLEPQLYHKRRLRRSGIVPKSMWTESKYSATEYGTNLLQKIFGRTNTFSYPKSPYTVIDCIRSATDNPDALILDFFAGSGTTLHATCLLNSEDGGNRRCVLVTNNEVSENEAKALTKAGLKPSDEKWEREGICRAVTIPRCKYVINGAREDGTPLAGKYLSGRALSDGFEANLQAFSLDFLDPLSVMRGGKFADIAPILWLLAGARGALISPKEIADESKAWIWPKGSEFVVCRDDGRFGEALTYLESLSDDKRKRVRHIFLVTNAREAWIEWREILVALIPGVQVHQLFRDYLENYRLGENRAITDESLVGTLDEQE
jgi:adenine-specific DNA-methyltransferase